MLYSIKGKIPNVADSVFIAPGAFVIAGVTIEEYASVWFNSVIRGDVDDVHIGNSTNIQDNCTVHPDKSCPVYIGDRVTIGHNCVIHGCTIGNGAMIGMQCTLLNRCHIGEDAIIGAGSLVTSGIEIPPRSLAMGSPARVIRELKPEEIEKAQRLYKIYRERSQLYREQIL